MRLEREQSLVVLIDMQQKLAPAIHETTQVQQAALWVLEVAQQLHVPVFATEQYPQGLGETVPVLRHLIAPVHIFSKIHFSALREPDIRQVIQQQQRQQIVLIGTETHVCVLQTALDLLSSGYQVFVVAAAVGSRTIENKQLALSRLQQAGASIISLEMLAFEWLDKAGNDKFRTLNQGWIR
ncbi:isochorismatase family protein [Rheinheimera sp.]|uniref:isochorismatase family protein n=1 Tax=Rheinheimera sp. TaxID=1869214 RepID=UPI0027B8FFC7|nr:isochorismatase family protein [Rheinheimera sp.]